MGTFTDHVFSCKNSYKWDFPTTSLQDSLKNELNFQLRDFEQVWMYLGLSSVEGTFEKEIIGSLSAKGASDFWQWTRQGLFYLLFGNSGFAQ